MADPRIIENSSHASSNHANSAAYRVLLDAGAALGTPRNAQHPHAMQVAVVPAGYVLEPLPLREEPAAWQTVVRLRDAASFLRYVADHHDDRTRIYATVEPARFLAVIDDHERGSDVPSWREFRAEFLVPASREWKTWTTTDRKAQTQLAFAEFIQDNLPDIVEPEGAQLLEMALNFEASSAGTFIAKQRLKDGSHELTWRADNDTASSVRLPDHIAISIPVFERELPSLMQARLRHKVSPEGKLTITYELVRPHKVLEAAFDDAWERIETGSGVPILLGTPE